MEVADRPDQKDVFAKDLADRQSFLSLFLVRDKQLLVGKNGKSYLSLSLCDSSGSLDARVWENVDTVGELIQDGDIVRVKGIVQLFQNRRQAVIHKVERLVPGTELDLSLFVQKSFRQPEEMLAELLQMAEQMQNPHIRQLVLESLRDPEIRSRLLVSPAAKTIHHAWVGGLLEHVLSICGLMRGIHAHYKTQNINLNLDYLLFGAIFHDLGKIWELDVVQGQGLSFAYSDKGRLLGHMVLSIELIEKKSARILGFPEGLKDILKHIVLSHHGRLEYGSPKTPSFLEAFIVAAVDDFDSKISSIAQILRNESDNADGWSRYSQLFERYFLLRP